jgi:hypothetical protein
MNDINAALNIDIELDPSMDSRLAEEPMLQWFRYSHLPDKLKVVSQQFCGLANRITLWLPRNAERTVALRKLLEAKDAAVRAAIAK